MYGEYVQPPPMTGQVQMTGQTPAPNPQVYPPGPGYGQPPPAQIPYGQPVQPQYGQPMQPGYGAPPGQPAFGSMNPSYAMAPAGQLQMDPGYQMAPPPPGYLQPPPAQPPYGLPQPAYGQPGYTAMQPQPPPQASPRVIRKIEVVQLHGSGPRHADTAQQTCCLCCNIVCGIWFFTIINIIGSITWTLYTAISVSVYELIKRENRSANAFTLFMTVIGIWLFNTLCSYYMACVYINYRCCNPKDKKARARLPNAHICAIFNIVIGTFITGIYWQNSKQTQWVPLLINMFISCALQFYYLYVIREYVQTMNDDRLGLTT